MQRKTPLTSDENVKAVLQIKINDFPGNYLFNKKKLFSWSSFQCVNELKQDMHAEQELLL